MSGFDLEKFVESFPVLLEAEGGSAKLRALAIELAVCGDLECDSAPSQWKRVALGDIVESFQNGLSKRRGDAGVPVPVLRLADIERGERLRESDLREIVLTAAELEQYRVGRGDVLVIRVNGSADLVGRFVPCGVDRVWAYSDHLIRLRLRADLVDARFLCAVSRSASARQYLAGKTVTTAGQRTINQGGLAGLSFLLPPLAEQKRIVAKVDELMRLIDQLEAKQAKKREVQTRFRAAALGALTAAEGEEEVAAAWGRVAGAFDVVTTEAEHITSLRLHVGRLLFSGGLKNFATLAKDASTNFGTAAVRGSRRAEPRGAGEGIMEAWRVLPLESLCSAIIDSPHRTPTYSADGEFPALRPRDVTGGVLNLAGAARVVRDEYERQVGRRAPRAGDVVYSRELSFGWASVIPEGATVCLSQGMVSMEPGPLVSAQYLAIMLNSGLGRDQAQAAAVGAAHPHVNLKDIRQFTFPIPPRPVQEQLLKGHDALMKLCDDLEAKLAAKEAAAARLVDAVVREMAG